MRITDFMPPRDGAPQLVRIVEGVSGRVKMRSALRMRFSYGRIVPWVHKVDNRTVAVAGPDSVWFDTQCETYGENLTTYADFTVAAGERIAFTLSWQPSHHAQPPLPDPEGRWRRPRPSGASGSTTAPTAARTASRWSAP